VAREQLKLAAIVAAEVVDYSRLMGRDDSGTQAPAHHLIAECSCLILWSNTPRFSSCPRTYPRRPSPTPDKRALLAGYDQRWGN
jgi:hypothetical protein